MQKFNTFKNLDKDLLQEPVILFWCATSKALSINKVLQGVWNFIVYNTHNGVIFVVINKNVVDLNHLRDSVKNDLKADPSLKTNLLFRFRFIFVNE